MGALRRTLRPQCEALPGALRRRLPPCSSHARRAPRLLRPPRALRRRLPTAAKPTRSLAPQASRARQTLPDPCAAGFIAFLSRVEGAEFPRVPARSCARRRHKRILRRGGALAPRRRRAARSVRLAVVRTRRRKHALAGRRSACAACACACPGWAMGPRGGRAKDARGSSCASTAARRAYSLERNILSPHSVQQQHTAAHAHLRTLAHARRERALPVTTLVPRVGKA